MGPPPFDEQGHGTANCKVMRECAWNYSSNSLLIHFLKNERQQLFPIRSAEPSQENLFLNQFSGPFSSDIFFIHKISLYN